ncbi:type 1 glutamine amidotransferase domain-containing protein [Streptomyces decoyicus]|uniref:type 1 glutamine amidotransferase domain-containing protein n=1 Tax=Streptomyces decoyicus TaxID=249567 RepID=UPI003641F673
MRPRLLTGVLFGRLGAEEEPRRCYEELTRSEEFTATVAWAELAPEEYDGLILPGGHAPGMRQYLGSEVLRQQAGRFWALDRPVGVICQGVLVPARAREASTGRSLPADRRTACLPKYMERSAYLTTAWRLGRYYRTYPAYMEDEVRAVLDGPDARFERGPRVLAARGHRDRRLRRFRRAGRPLSLGAPAGRRLPLRAPVLCAPGCLLAGRSPLGGGRNV